MFDDHFVIRGIGWFIRLFDGRKTFPIEKEIDKAWFNYLDPVDILLKNREFVEFVNQLVRNMHR